MNRGGAGRCPAAAWFCEPTVWHSCWAVGCSLRTGRVCAPVDWAGGPNLRESHHDGETSVVGCGSERIWIGGELAAGAMPANTTQGTTIERAID